MPEGILVFTVTRLEMWYLTMGHHGVRGAYERKNLIVYTREDNNLIVRRYILWHEWMHHRIYDNAERENYSHSDCQRMNRMFDRICHWTWPFILMFLTWFARDWNASMNPVYMRPFGDTRYVIPSNTP